MGRDELRWGWKSLGLDEMSWDGIISIHWGVYKVGQEKFDTNVNKRRKISENFFLLKRKIQMTLK